MKPSKVDERLCSLLNLEQDASADDIFAAVQEINKERRSANDTAGALSSALTAIEEALGVGESIEATPDLALEAIGALQSERSQACSDRVDLLGVLDLDVDTEVAEAVEAIRELQAAQKRGEENGRKFREAAGLDPHAPPERVIEDVRSMRHERIAVRRTLALQADASSDVVYDAVDKLKRRASDQDVSNQERRDLRLALGRVATELDLPQPGVVQDIIETIRKLKPQREAGMSNAAWLAAAWETLTEHLRIQPGASLQDALVVIDEAIDVRDRVVAQFDLSHVHDEEPIGPAVEHRILAAQAAATEVGERLAAQEEQLMELRQLHQRYCVAANIDPALYPRQVVAALARLSIERDELSAFEQAVLMALGLSSGASLDDVLARVRSMEIERAAAAEDADVLDRLAERASVVSDLVIALTSANARLAVSIGEASR